MVHFFDFMHVTLCFRIYVPFASVVLISDGPLYPCPPLRVGIKMLSSYLCHSSCSIFLISQLHKEFVQLY